MLIVKDTGKVKRNTRARLLAFDWIVNFVKIHRTMTGMRPSPLRRLEIVAVISCHPARQASP